MGESTTGEPVAERWFYRHRARLDRAVEVMTETREAWSPFVESPSRKRHPEGAHEAGRAAFEAMLNRPFALEQPGQVGWVGEERSPYTGAPLGVTYPRVDVAALMAGVTRAWDSEAWRGCSIEGRVGVCMEILARWEADVFANAYATMHTTGQAFMLAFAGSGASALDRGLEGVAAAWAAMSAIPREARFTRTFGRGEPVHLYKKYRLMPVGVAVVLSCGSYPSWNAYPAILANLATGNPVVLKPHPDAILPMARAVALARHALVEADLPADLITLAADTWADPVAVELFDHPAVKVVDFTGGCSFGAWIEDHYPRHQVYTETAGCNAVVLESTKDLDAALGAIAHALCLFSAQMCTAPQNIWIPPHVLDGDTPVARDEVIRRLVAHVDAIVADPATAAGLCGALHSPRTLDDLQALTAAAGPDRLVRASAPYAHPEHPDARTATPLLIRLPAADRALAQQERFGPVAFILDAADRDEALRLATSDAHTFGAIASFAYTTDAAWLPAVEDAFARAGASVGVNLIRQRPINFTAGFSDYHVTGLNPAGNACLTDPAFVSRRFRIVQARVEV